MASCSSFLASRSFRCRSRCFSSSVCEFLLSKYGEYIEQIQRDTKETILFLSGARKDRETNREEAGERERERQKKREREREKEKGRKQRKVSRFNRFSMGFQLQFSPSIGISCTCWLVKNVKSAKWQIEN